MNELGIGAATEPPAQPLSFVVNGTPIAWARARLNGARHYKPAVMRAYQQTIAYAAKTRLGWAQPTDKAVFVTVEAVLAVPRSWTKAKRNAALQGLKRPGRPDLDNYVKIVMDALNGVVWLDDAQVADLRATKRYGETPHLRVSIHELDD